MLIYFTILYPCYSKATHTLLLFNTVNHEIFTAVIFSLFSRLDPESENQTSVNIFIEVNYSTI